MSNTISRRRDPFFADFDNLVRATFGPAATTSPRVTGFSPAAETHRDGDDAVIRLELPGVAVDDVTVEIKGRHLVVSGERRDGREEEAEGRRFSEFRYGRFTRSFRLAPSVTAEAVSASYDAGVLTVRVSSAYAETQGHKIAISTGSDLELVDGNAEDGESQEG